MIQTVHISEMGSKEKDNNIHSVSNYNYGTNLNGKIYVILTKLKAAEKLSPSVKIKGYSVTIFLDSLTFHLLGVLTFLRKPKK